MIAGTSGAASLAFFLLLPPLAFAGVVDSAAFAGVAASFSVVEGADCRAEITLGLLSDFVGLEDDE
jgi:hypothetical protein